MTNALPTYSSSTSRKILHFCTSGTTTRPSATGCQSTSNHAGSSKRVFAREHIIMWGLSNEGCQVVHQVVAQDRACCVSGLLIADKYFHFVFRRVPFTQEDREHLAYYIATRCPTRDGRMGNSAYKDLEQLVRTHACALSLLLISV